MTLEVKERGADELGSRNTKRLRRQGLIPGVLYGKTNKAFVVGERELRVALTGPGGLNGIVDVVIAGQKTPHHAVLKDYQQHPIRGTITHVDFHEVGSTSRSTRRWTSTSWARLRERSSAASSSRLPAS